MQIPKIRVRIGEWDFSTTGESHAHVERKVTRKVVHPKYNFFTYENDLALVRLEKKVPFQPNIVPICLPGNDDLLIGKSKSLPDICTVAFSCKFVVEGEIMGLSMGGFHQFAESKHLQILKSYSMDALLILLQPELQQ